MYLWCVNAWICVCIICCQAPLRMRVPFAIEECICNHNSFNLYIICCGCDCSWDFVSFWVFIFILLWFLTKPSVVILKMSVLYICIYTHIYTHTHIYIYIHCLCIHMYVYRYIHWSEFTYVCVCIYTLISISCQGQQVISGVHVTCLYIRTYQPTHIETYTIYVYNSDYMYDSELRLPVGVALAYHRDLFELEAKDCSSGDIFHFECYTVS
jgi:hypothetical protein